MPVHIIPAVITEYDICLEYEVHDPKVVFLNLHDPVPSGIVDDNGPHVFDGIGQVVFAEDEQHIGKIRVRRYYVKIYARITT